MKRILVTGNAGSGKSTFAGRISAELGIPCHGLDCVVWQSGWKKTPAEEKARMIREMTDLEEWVIDGVSFDVHAAADVIVFLDLRRRISYWRVMRRNWRYLFRSRPDLPPGCPEILIVPALFKIIWNFPGKIRPRILEQARQAGTRQWFFHVRTAGELEACFQILGTRNLLTSLHPETDGRLE